MVNAATKSCAASCSSFHTTIPEARRTSGVGTSRPCLKNSCRQCPERGQTRTDANDPLQTSRSVDGTRELEPSTLNSGCSSKVYPSPEVQLAEQANGYETKGRGVQRRLYGLHRSRRDGAASSMSVL